MDATQHKKHRNRLMEAKLAKPDYVKFKRRELVEVACKGCGTPIRTMAPDTDFGTERRAGNRIVVQERLTMICLNNYRELLLEMNDGSKHVTNACADCAMKALTDDGLRDALYAADLQQWATEGPVPDSYLQRDPVAVLRVAPMIS